ncbi:Chymotrypsin-C [Manis pentadactyla]|nr:Chymotrypsin-C [Manis pentadactyla]
MGCGSAVPSAPPWVSARVAGPHPCPWRQRAELTSVTIFNSGVCVTGGHTAASRAGHGLGAFLKGALRESLSMREGLVKGRGESATESEIGRSGQPVREW